MKRAITLALAATLVASLSPLASGAPASGPQKEEGNVLLPGPDPNGSDGCWTGYGRRAWIYSGGTTAGPMAHMIEVDPATWGGKFKLEVAGATGAEDLDVTFYVDPGKVDPTDPAMQSGIIESSAYTSRKAGGETGAVPPEATLALVCLATGTGYDADLTYTATPPAKKKK